MQNAGAHALAASHAQEPYPAAPPVADQALGSTVLMGSMNLEGQHRMAMAGAAAMLGQTASSGVKVGGLGWWSWVSEALDLRRGYREKQGRGL